ncbi:MAG: FAD-dependent oxidoreductase, partial [Longimicrobiales bacterium]|nr:FAD-dependent oxidoreductase [Longimicrobiales bacterium]
PLRVAPELVVKETEGVRPHRARGFRIDVEDLGGTHLVHHYGHGGGGFSLSWGTAELAIARLDDLDASPERTPVAVLGAGAVGLATASLLQARGHTVEIISADAIDETTSAVAGASWYPVGVFAGAPPSPARGALFETAARRAHTHFTALAAQPGTGVRHGDEYVPDTTRARLEAGHGWVFRRLRDLYPGGEIIGRPAHPFATRWALRYRTLFMDAPRYLPALLERILDAGGAFTRRRLTTLDEIRALPQRVVFNCTGAGARTLVGDHTLTPVRGRLFHLAPQPGVDYGVQIDDFRYMVPRASALVLGTSWEPEGSGIVQEGRDAESVIEEISRRTG